MLFVDMRCCLHPPVRRETAKLAVVIMKGGSLDAIHPPVSSWILPFIWDSGDVIPDRS